MAWTPPSPHILYRLKTYERWAVRSIILETQEVKEMEGREPRRTADDLRMAEVKAPRSLAQLQEPSAVLAPWPSTCRLTLSAAMGCWDNHSISAFATSACALLHTQGTWPCPGRIIQSTASPAPQPSQTSPSFFSYTSTENQMILLPLLQSLVEHPTILEPKSKLLPAWKSSLLILSVSSFT